VNLPQYQPWAGKCANVETEFDRELPIRGVGDRAHPINIIQHAEIGAQKPSQVEVKPLCKRVMMPEVNKAGFENIDPSGIIVGVTTKPPHPSASAFPLPIEDAHPIGSNFAKKGRNLEIRGDRGCRADSKFTPLQPRRRRFMAASAPRGRSPGFDVGRDAAGAAGAGSSFARIAVRVCTRGDSGQRSLLIVRFSSAARASVCSAEGQVS